METSSSRLSSLRMNRIEPTVGRTTRQTGARGNSFGEMLNARLAPTEVRTPVQRAASARILPQSPKDAIAAPPEPPQSQPPQPPPIDQMKQTWLNANAGPYASLLRDSLSRNSGYSLRPVQIQWTNLSNGRPENITRAVGNVDRESGLQLATLMGGTLVESPFTTFGAQQRDQYIRLPNGQMVDASVLANSLNQARGAVDPFWATQSVLEVYKAEAAQYSPGTSTDMLDRVSNGRLAPGSNYLQHS